MISQDDRSSKFSYLNDSVLYYYFLLAFELLLFVDGINLNK
jgi:hypothetical protein